MGKQISAVRWLEPTTETPALARRMSSQVSPFNFARAVAVGVFASTAMMMLLDAFAMMGLTQFTYEHYLGSLLRISSGGTHNWTYGFFLNWGLGAVFACGYAVVFEYGFRRATVRAGLMTSLIHTAIAAAALFPLFNSFHALVGTEPYAHDFGFLGYGLGRLTPFLIVVSHLMFGATMGLFYGPVRAARLHARAFEPGESSFPGEKGVITAEDDPMDRVAL